MLGACGDDDAGGSDPAKGPGGSSSGDGGPNGQSGPQCTDCTPAGPMTFALPSPAGIALWTTPTMEKVVREAAPPTNKGDAMQIYAAKNEFEPFQLVGNANAATSVALSMPAFTGPGSISRIEMKRVEYVQDFFWIAANTHVVDRHVTNDACWIDDISRTTCNFLGRFQNPELF